MNINQLIAIAETLKHGDTSLSPEDIANKMNGASCVTMDEANKDALCSILTSRWGDDPSNPAVITDLDDITLEDKDIAAEVMSGGATPNADFFAEEEEAEENMEAVKNVDFEFRPGYDVLFENVLNESTKGAITKVSDLKTIINTSAAATADVNRLKAEVNKLKANAITAATPAKIEASGDIPNGKPITMKAYETLGRKKSKALDFDVPAFEWDAPHPHVPEVDPNYIIRPELALLVMSSLIFNEPMWLTGHTGTGKTTLVEQIAARLNYPVIRINFDSEIGRIDLVGRDKLKANSDGNVISEFLDGILPQALQSPCILICDEMDFVHSDVSYVMQRLMEGNGLMLNEDAGRLVKPHPMFRVIATGNTVGQGDELGLYQGARQQSAAFLNRFTSWATVPYLSPEDERKLLKTSEPSIKDESLDLVMRYVGEHREAFQSAEILQPISPRALIVLVKKIAWISNLLPEEKAIETSFFSTIFNGATQMDRNVMIGLFDRVKTKPAEAEAA